MKSSTIGAIRTSLIISKSVGLFYFARLEIIQAKYQWNQQRRGISLYFKLNWNLQ